MDDEKRLDALDRRILVALQGDGRLSYEELGGQIGLSASATLRRVKRLEEAGVLAGYVALVKAQAVGLGLTAFINVKMSMHNEGFKRSPTDVFAAAVQTWPEVVECVMLTGEMDYLLKMLVADMNHYAHFVLNTLLKHPSVQDCRTSFVMKAIKRDVTLV